MRRAFVVAPLAVALAVVACPSLDGFTDHVKDPTDASASGGGFLSLEDAAKLCGKVQTCRNLGYSIGYSLLIPVQTSNFSTCVDILSAPLPKSQLGVTQQAASLACAASAANCPTAAACLPYEFIDLDDPRCGGLDGGANGDCSPDKKAVYACTSQLITHCDHPYFYPGSTCLVDSSGVHRCAASQTCTSTAGECNGSIVTYCGSVSNFAYGEDCSYWGASCGTDQASGVQDCVLNGLTPFCNQDSVQCVGDRVRSCYGGFFSEIDCAALGGKCDPDPVAHCSRAPNACKVTDPTVNVCDGDSISLCVGSKSLSFDCKSIGLSCVVDPKGNYCG